MLGGRCLRGLPRLLYDRPGHEDISIIIILNKGKINLTALPLTLAMQAQGVEDLEAAQL